MRGSPAARPPLRIYCKCRKFMLVPAEHRGKRIKCKNCGRELRVNTAARLPPRLGALLTVLSLAYLATILVLTIVMWRLGDVWAPATVLLFISRWEFLLPLVVLLPAALVFRVTLTAPLALAALVGIGPLMGFRSGWHRLLSHPAGMHVRILTYNVDGGDAVAPRLADFLADAHPDFVAIQECGPALVEQLRRMPGWFHHDVRQLCFLSRYPLLDSVVMNRDALERLAESNANIGGSGDVVRYAVKLPQAVINVTNLHLETPRKGLEGMFDQSYGAARLRDNTELRLVEAQRARVHVDSGTAPSLVAGDFNTPIESRIFQRAWGDLTDAFSRAGFGLGMTRYNGWIRVRIDHVLSGEGWYVDHAEVGPDLGSDHVPLIVDLTLAPGK